MYVKWVRGDETECKNDGDTRMKPMANKRRTTLKMNGMKGENRKRFGRTDWVDRRKNHSGEKLTKSENLQHVMK